MERLLEYFTPEKYVLDLYIDKERKSIKGKVVVTGESKAELIKFHCVDLKILNVAVNEKNTEYKCADDLLMIETGVGDNVIKIEYEGKLNENMQGAYLST